MQAGRLREVTHLEAQLPSAWTRDSETARASPGNRQAKCSWLTYLKSFPIHITGYEPKFENTFDEAKKFTDEKGSTHSDFSGKKVQKYAAGAIIGVAGSGNASKAKGAGKSAVPVASIKCDVVANLGGLGRLDYGGFRRHARRVYVNACHCLVHSVNYEFCATILSSKNLKISND